MYLLIVLWPTTVKIQNIYVEMSNYVSYVVDNKACYKFSKNFTKRFTKIRIYDFGIVNNSLLS